MSVLRQGRLTSLHYGCKINPPPSDTHGEAHFTLFGPNTKARSYSLALCGLDTLMRYHSIDFWRAQKKENTTALSNNVHESVRNVSNYYSYSLVALRCACDDASGGRRPAQIPQGKRQNFPMLVTERWARS